MSDRDIYTKIPLAQRCCSKCQEPIERNIARTKDGRIWHYGCLMDAKDEYHECLECFSNFDGTEASFLEGQSSYNDEYRQTRKPICPHCGSSNLKCQDHRKNVILEEI